MPRTFSTGIAHQLSLRTGTEPLIIVEISWVGDSFIAYSGQKLNGGVYPRPQLLEIGNFDTTVIVGGGSDSQNVSLTLNDINGEIRTIIDQHDIHLRPVKIYLGFQGLQFSEKALMFEGLINSPIQWDEGARTLTFDVFSKLEDTEVGFTMEDGDFPFVPPADRNKPWPLVFGSVCNMKAEAVTTNRKGFLAAGQGVVDPTIEERLCQACFLLCPEDTGSGVNTSLEAKVEIGGGPNLPEGPLGPGADAASARKQDQNCLTRRFNEVCTIITERANQSQHVTATMTIRGGADFPQNEEIRIRINDVEFIGTMVGEVFTITNVFHPALEDIDNPPCKAIKGAKTGYRFRVGDTEKPTTVAECEAGGSTEQFDLIDGSGASWEYYNTFDKSDFIWLPPGTEVLLADESPIVNIVSLLPGTVDQVAAYRTYGDTSLLSVVDPSRYTVITSDFSGYDVVEVRLTRALSLLKDEDWDDEIYVSFTSSIGPNPADIIEYLVDTYTDYTVDATSFAAVESSLTNYPSNFFLKERKSVLQVMKDIAYQARCALFIRNNVVFLTYLSDEPTSLKTLTDSDILSNSFRFVHTPTEDLVTRHEIKWSEGEAEVNKKDSPDREFILKHNVPKYGTLAQNYDFYTMNIFELVEKSATFWMIRKSNTWLLVEFTTPIKHLDLDVFDCVTINVSQFPTTKVVIESTNYNMDDNTVRFTAWTPILSGSTTEHIWAWPANEAELAQFPVNNSVDEIGDGYDFDVIPPVGHPLRGGYDPQTVRIQTSGDPNPSDVGDTLPTLVCKVATGTEIQDEVEPDITPFEPLADQNFADSLDEKEEMTQQTTDADEGDEERSACGDPSPGTGGCIYEVIIVYVTPRTVTTGKSPPKHKCNNAGPCKSANGGLPCSSSLHNFCHAFGSLFAATAFQSAKAEEAQALRDNCGYNTGKTDVWLAGNIQTIEGESTHSACETVPDSGNQTGVVAEPTFDSGDLSTAPDIGDL